MWKNSNVILVSFKVGIGNVIIMYKTEKNLLWGLNIFKQKKIKKKNSKPPHLVVRQNSRRRKKRGRSKETTKLVH